MSKFIYTSILEYVDNNKDKLTLNETLIEYKKSGDLSEYHIPKIEDNNLKWLFNQLLSIADELRKYNIESSDFMNTSNWGYKDKNTLGVFDLGFGDYFEEFEEAPDEIIMEEENNLTLLDFIKKKLNIKHSKYIDSGFFGFAHDIGDGKILKITKDKSEAINAKKVIGKDLKHIANVYKVKKLETKSKMYFIIILERLELDNILDKWYEELEELFLEDKSLHLDKDIISKIRKANKYYGDFLEDVVNNGSKYAWGKWSDIISNNKELDKNYDIFNDLDELSEWIKGSKTNDNYADMSPPMFVDNFLKELLS